MALDLGTLVAHIEADDSGYNRTLDRSEGRLSRFGSAMATGLKYAGGAFLTVAGAAGALGLKTAAANEQADISFTTMLGNAKSADKFLRNLGSFAAKTPFEFPELQTAAQSLISVGIDADKVIPIMTSLGNATAGMGTGSEGVKRATVALQQMNAAGKISMEDLNQLRDAGIPVYDLLAAATGKSVEQVAALANKGKLGREELGQLMKALESGKGLERFAGMMDKQSQSITGLWSTLQDTVSMGMAKAIEPLVPLIKDGLGKAIDFAAAAVPKLRDGMITLVAAAQGLYALIVNGDYTGKLREAFGWEEDSSAVDRLFDIRDGILNVGTAAQGLYALLANGDYTGKLREAFGWEEDSDTVGQLLELRDTVTSLFDSIGSGDGGNALGSMLATVTTHVRDFASAAPALGPTMSAFGTALRFVADHADQVGKVLPFVVAGFVALKTAQAANTIIGRDSAAGMVLQLTSTLSLAAANRSLAASQRALAASQGAQTAATNGGVLANIRAAGAWVAARAASVASTVATTAQTAAQWLLNAAMSANPIMIVVLAIAALVAAIVLAYQHSETFRNIVNAAWGAVKTGIKAVVDWLRVAVPAVFAWIKNAFLRYTPLGIVISHWGQIRAAIGVAVNWIKGAIAWFGSLPGKFSDWFGRAKDAAGRKVNELVTFVKGLPRRILDGLGSLGSTLVEKGQNLVEGLIQGIRNMAGRLAGFVKQFIVDHIPGPVAEALGIASPSRVMAQLTRWVPLGAIEGLKQTGPQLRRAMVDLVQPPPMPPLLANSGTVMGRRSASPALAATAAGSVGGTVRLDSFDIERLARAVSNVQLRTSVSASGFDEALARGGR